MKHALKRSEAVGLYGLAGAVAITVPLLFWRSTKAAPAPQEICLLPGLLVMAIPQDDSPCSSSPMLIWGDPVLKQFAQGIGATALQEEALPEILRAAILEEGPEILYLFGHGNTTVYTCQRCLFFFLSSGANLDLVANKYVHLLSCLTAQDLGNKIIQAGAKGYFGYWDEFVTVAKARPGSGRFVNATFLCDIEIEIALMESIRDLKAIYDRAVARYNAEIAYWQENWSRERCDGARIQEYEAQTLIAILIHDRDALRYYAPAPAQAAL